VLAVGKRYVTEDDLHDDAQVICALAATGRSGTGSNPPGLGPGVWRIRRPVS
jgi:hypothetical protein